MCWFRYGEWWGDQEGTGDRSGISGDLSLGKRDRLGGRSRPRSSIRWRSEKERQNSSWQRKQTAKEVGWTWTPVQPGIFIFIIIIITINFRVRLTSVCIILYYFLKKFIEIIFSISDKTKKKEKRRRYKSLFLIFLHRLF